MYFICVLKTRTQYILYILFTLHFLELLLIHKVL